MEKLDFGRLDSATKYPSIPTYHVMDGHGNLTEDRLIEFGSHVLVEEKLDGTNVRIICMPGGDWFIGSRKEILTARGDRVWNRAQAIVTAMKALVDLEGVAELNQSTSIITVYGEMYGDRGLPAWRQYGAAGVPGFRVFDVNAVSVDVLLWERDEIASWRDRGGQSWLSVKALGDFCDAGDLRQVPPIASIPPSFLPDTIQDAATWLYAQHTVTTAATSSGGVGSSEGVVLRSADRSIIAKLRLEDYEKALRRRGVSRDSEAA